MKVKSDKHLKMKKMCSQIKFGHYFIVIHMVQLDHYINHAYIASLSLELESREKRG